MKIAPIEIERQLTTPTEPPPPRPLTWWDELKARMYVGGYARQMRPGAYDCMSSSAQRISLTPIEEARFARGVLGLIETQPEEWTFSTYTAAHRSGMEIWSSLGNGSVYVQVWHPQRISLRRGTQRRFYAALKRLRTQQHRKRHLTISPEADKLISTIVRAHHQQETTP